MKRGEANALDKPDKPDKLDKLERDRARKSAPGCNK